MWAKGAAVGNAARCPRTRPVRRRRIVHMSMACRARSARPPRARDFFWCRAHVSAVTDVAFLSCPRIRSFAFSARQALMRRCSVRSCALLA
jgi:hypothetical protein